MKKLLTILALTTLFSCTHQDQKVRLDLSLNVEKSNIGNDVGINLMVFDDRLEKGFIGSKEHCDNQKINITLEQNLAELLKKQMISLLMKKGFRQGSDRIIELHIQELQYKAICSFMIGKSEANILIRVVSIDPKTNRKNTKDFQLSLNGKHFIIPLESSDANAINEIFNEILAKILDDDVILRN